MKFVKILLVLLFISAGFLYFIFSSHSLIKASTAISSEELAQMRSSIQVLGKQFALSSNELNVEISTDELLIISKLISQSVKQLDVQLNLSAQSLYAVSSLKLKLFSVERYLNAYCFLSQGTEHIVFEECYLGGLPIHHKVIEFFVGTFISAALTTEQSQRYSQMYKDIRLQDEQLFLTINNVSAVKADLQNLTAMASNVRESFIPAHSVDLQRVGFYTRYLESLPKKEASLAPYVVRLFKEVKLQAFIRGNTLVENEAALWALVIVFGNDNFAHYLNFKYKKKVRFKPKKLANRYDLTLHFLYSVFLELTGEQHFAAKIGEYKELLDSNKGGSGFSFADLAADLAGIKLSQALTQSAAQSERILARFADLSTPTERSFFPAIKGLPEGIRDKRFIKKYGDVNDPRYLKLEAEINQRIDKLFIYQ